MRVIFAGTPASAVPALDALLASDHEVVAVVSRPDRGAGRGRRVVASPVVERASAAGTEVLRPENVTDPAFVTRLRELAPDCCAVVAYGALLPRSVLDLVPLGWLNLHFSVLPAWRGAAPVQHAIRAGDDVTGATVFEIERELDAGPVYGTLTEPVQPRDTAGELLGRLAHQGARLLVAVLDAIAAGDAVKVPQQRDGVSYAPKITPVDARVDWRQPALAVDRQVRAVTPAPGAWTPYRDGRLKLGPVTATDEAGLRAGELRVTRSAVLVGTGTTAVRLHDVQPPGRTMTDATAWARGARDADGLILAAP